MDAELAEHVRRARDGDQMAFGYVVTAFRDTALAWARRQTSGEHAAEDAVQDAFVLAFTRLAHLREVEAFAGWLQALVRTCSLRQLRRKMAEIDEDFEPAADDLPPERNLAAIEVREAVRGAVEELKPGLLAVMEKHYLAGQKLEEIAKELSLPLGTVKRRLFEAREKLRFKLAGFAAEDRGDEWKG